MENITVNVQSSIKITNNGKVIYFDPWQITDGEKADMIFITHNHHDHFSPEDINGLLKSDTIIIAPENMKDAAIKNISADSGNFIFVEPNNAYKTGIADFETLPSYNKLKPFHPKSAGWCGYVVTLSEKRYYVMGDTDFIKESENVKCDVLLIPIGGTFTMDVKKAAACVLAIKPEAVIPTHYGSIVGNKDDGEKLKEIIAEENSSISVMLKL